MEYPEAYATNLYASKLRRSSGEHHEPRLLRRRTASRIEPSVHSDQEHLSDEFRGLTPVSKSFSYDTTGADGRCKLGDYARLGLSDSQLLTPIMMDSNTVSNVCLPTPIGSSEALDHPRGPHESSMALRAASDDPSYPAVFVGSATTVVPRGARISRTEIKLGPMDKFTHEWLKPSPLKAPDIGGSLDDSDVMELNFQRSEDAVLLESGIGSPGGVFGLKWFDRWANFKWCLLFSVLSVFVYGITGLVCAIMTWFGSACLFTPLFKLLNPPPPVWQKADVMFVADGDILILITLASSILVLAALTGLTGTLLSSRPILAFYTLLLWLPLVAMCAIGYTAYKRSTFELEHKLDKSWIQFYTPLGRLVIQNALQCCGWSSPWHEGVPSGTCYPRTLLQGCKGPLLIFEQTNLRLVWATAFSLVPMHMINIFVVMLCASHITRTLGAGVALKRRGSMVKDMNLLMDRGGVGIGGARRPGVVRAWTNVPVREAREETVGLLGAYFDEVKDQ